MRSFALLLLLTLQASADPIIAAPALPFNYDCKTIRTFVAEHGRIEALALAIRNGATFAQLRAARKCLAAKSDAR